MTTNDCTRRAARLAAAVVMGAGLAGAALAAQAPPPPPPPEAGAPALRGPTVRERDVPGAPGLFGSEEGTRRIRERIPMPIFRDAVMSLRGEGVPAELRLTAEQLDAIEGLEREFQESRREYMMAHREEMRGLREQAGPGGGRDGGGEMRGRRRGRPENDDGGGDAMMPPPPPPPPGEGAAPPPERPTRRGGEGERGAEMTPQQRTAAARMREIESAAPQPEILYTQVWEELTEPQRAAAEAELDEFREERARQREEMMVRQRAPRAEAGPDGAPGPRGGEGEMRRPRQGDDEPGMRGGRGPGTPEQRERIERLIRVFNQLPAEDQERILERLEMRAREVGGPGAGEQPARPEGRRRRPERRPAPSMDDVDVPRPERDGGRPD